jgi:hypothetical protein
MFGTVMAALLVGHYLGDYFIQTDHQAQHKGLRGERSAEGRANCFMHALGYTLTLFLALGAVMLVDDVESTHSAQLLVWAVLVANGFTHYVIDRRWTLEWFARRISKSAWVDADAEALPKLDQAAHIVLLGAAALVIAAGIG